MKIEEVDVMSSAPEKPSFKILLDKRLAHLPQIRNRGEFLFIKQVVERNVTIAKSKEDEPIVAWHPCLTYYSGRIWSQIWYAFFASSVQVDKETVRNEIESFLGTYGTLAFQEKGGWYKIYLVKPEVVQALDALFEHKEVFKTILDSGMHLKDLTPGELQKMVTVMKKIV